MSKHLSKRQCLEQLRAQLESERSTFKSQWQDLGDYILPTRPRWTVTDANKGTRKNTKIINSTATMSARTLRSGMMSGITSPARPWFRLTTPDPDMAEYSKVKRWLHIVADRMSTAFLRSNLYNTLPLLYGDLGVFGTAPMMVEEDLFTTIRTSSFPIGSYAIAKDAHGKVNVFTREFRMTVRQLVQEFGEHDLRTGKAKWDNFSLNVRNMYDKGQYEAWVDVIHVICPNDDHDEESKAAKDKKFCSVYYEKGLAASASGQEIFLRESGYDEFPVLCPRWEVTGEDVYGTSCPGMIALGDIKALQVMEKRKAQAVEKMVNPPMMGPTSMKTQKVSILPGDVSYVDVREGMQGFRPAHEVNLRINELAVEIERNEQRIQKAFYTDLFLMMAESDRRQITATEIDERKEEKLIALGPVLEQMNQDLLDPLISLTFQMMLKQEQLPEIPEELQGMELKVEYISMMAQAQKLIGLAGMDRFWGMTERMSQLAPDALVKVNTDRYIEVYADNCGLNPAIMRTDEEADQIRQQAAQAQQAQAQAQSMRDVTSSVKNLAQAPVDGDNALTALLGQAQAGNLVPGA